MFLTENRHLYSMGKKIIKVKLFMEIFTIRSKTTLMKIFINGEKIIKVKCVL